MDVVDTRPTFGGFYLLKADTKRRVHFDRGAAEAEAGRLANTVGSPFVIAQEVGRVGPGSREDA